MLTALNAHREPNQGGSSGGKFPAAHTRGRVIALGFIITSVLLSMLGGRRYGTGSVRRRGRASNPGARDGRCHAGSVERRRAAPAHAATHSTPTPTPTHVLVNPIELEVQADSGTAGEEVEFRVVLHTRGQAVAGVQVDLEADAALHFATQALGEPQCQANPATGKTDTGFHLFPLERRTLALRAVVLSFTDLAPIADGSVLFTCRLYIGTGTPPGSYELRPTNLLGSTPRGERIDAVGRDRARRGAGGPDRHAAGARRLGQ